MKRSGKVMFLIGCLLIISSLGLLIFSQIRTGQIQKENHELVQTIETILPERRAGIKDTYRNMEMPALEVGGEDFVALLEIPSFGCKLPVFGSWEKGKVSSHPCRFWGTVYDGTLIVGGADQSGQFDFFDRISNDAAVTVTDMTGSTFSYVVERVEHSDSAQAEVLMDNEADLTLFARDARMLDYIILRCVEK
ncbi:MAG: hypothetical protein IKU81_02115 [Oscillibacter sp.]|nr:hypothetical protein [Oscillibacter sp.]